MQDVLREYGDQRRGAGKQHGEQVERDGAEQQPIAENQDKARQDGGQVAFRRRGSRNRPAAHEGGERYRAGESERGPAIGHRRTHRIEQATQPGTGDRSDLPTGRGPGYSAGEMRLRHQVGHQRPPRRRGDRPCDTEAEGKGQDGDLGNMAGDCQAHQDQGGDQLGADADQEEQPSVDAIREMPGGEREQHGGQELRQPHQPELERIAGDFIDLPGERRGLDLERDGRQEIRPGIEREVALPECGQTGAPRFCSHDRWLSRLSRYQQRRGKKRGNTAYGAMP
jgi:hypothetical protein